MKNHHVYIKIYESGYHYIGYHYGEVRHVGIASLIGTYPSEASIFEDGYVGSGVLLESAFLKDKKFTMAVLGSYSTEYEALNAEKQAIQKSSSDPKSLNVQYSSPAETIGSLFKKHFG